VTRRVKATNRLDRLVYPLWTFFVELTEELLQVIEEREQRLLERNHLALCARSPFQLELHEPAFESLNSLRQTLDWRDSVAREFLHELSHAVGCLGAVLWVRLVRQSAKSSEIHASETRCVQPQALMHCALAICEVERLRRHG